MRALLVYLDIYICALLLLRVFVYHTPARFKTTPLTFFDWKTQIQMCVATRKADSNLSRHYLPTIRASNGWINKALFRVVFGKGIVPAVQPLGPWLELRESTLCNTPADMKSRCPVCCYAAPDLGLHTRH